MIYAYVLIMLQCWVPISAYAELVSENYTVDGPSLISGNVSLGATSSNYVSSEEAGNLYILRDVLSNVSTTPSSSHHISTSVIGNTAAFSAPITSVLYGPRSAIVGTIVTLYLVVRQTDGASFGGVADNVTFTIQGANAQTLAAQYLGIGLYAASYQVIKPGLDMITATFNDMNAAHNITGMLSGTLFTEVLSLPTDIVTPVTLRHLVPEYNTSVDPVDPGSKLSHDSVPVAPAPVDSRRQATLSDNLSPTALFYIDILAVISGAGGLAGVLSVLFGLSRVPFSFNALDSVFSGLKQTFGLFVWRKRRRPWGTVYDSVTKVPLDPAYVQLWRSDGTKQDEAITDLDGRYGFVVGDGTYTLTVNKTNYVFPSVYAPVFGHDVLYSHLYFGGAFTPSAAVAYDVPLDPVGYDWNQVEKIRTGQMYFFHRFDVWFISIADGLFYLGAVAMAVQYFFEQTLTTSIYLGSYLILLGIRLWSGKPILYGALTKQGKSLSFAVVRVFRGDYEVSHKVADQYGRYAILVLPGTYTVKIEERLGVDNYQTVSTLDVNATQGIINVSVAC